MKIDIFARTCYSQRRQDSTRRLNSSRSVEQTTAGLRTQHPHGTARTFTHAQNIPNYYYETSRKAETDLPRPDRRTYKPRWQRLTDNRTDQKVGQNEVEWREILAAPKKPPGWWLMINDKRAISKSSHGIHSRAEPCVYMLRQQNMFDCFWTQDCKQQHI